MNDYKNILVEFADGNRELLQQTEEISESQVDRFHILLATHCEDFFGCHRLFA